MSERYVAFFSYTHADDEGDDGLLSSVRGRLENELRLTLGDREVRIFQDRDDLNPGDVWEARLAKALDEAAYLIPVITPSFFASEICRREFMRFWDKANADPGSARIIPIYWRKHFPLDGVLPPTDDPLLKAVRSIQYDDWRDVRQLGISDRGMRQKIEAMAIDLALRYRQGAQAIAAPALELSAPSREHARHSADGRMRIEAKVASGAEDGWFTPGKGSSQWFNDHEAGPEMVVVPSGKFTMGSSVEEIEALKRDFPDRRSGWFAAEGPQRTISIAKPFAVGRHAVTRGQFAAFVAATGHVVPDAAGTFEDGEWLLREGRSWRNPGFAQDDSHPVVCCNWDDARAYVSWLAGVTGKDYRLLSEAEWEYAARAGTTGSFWWGASISTSEANYDGGRVFRGGQRGQFRNSTMPVGSFAANGWGIYQMNGNVWEWCRDFWHETYSGDGPRDGSAWAIGAQRGLRVLRGGAWDSPPEDLRATSRYPYPTQPRNSILGFRVARSV